MNVELLWFSGCPNWRETEVRLRQAQALAGADADVVLVEVTTPEDAERLRFRGSPTVLIDGRDPFAEESDPVGLSCRVFRTPDGLRGAPTVEQLVAALQGPGVSTPAGTVRCGCCARDRPRGKVAELGSTPGVFVCRRCAVWALLRSFRL